MRMFNCVDGQSLQIGDFTMTILEIDGDEILLGIDSPEGSLVEPSDSDLVMQSEWRLD